MFSGIDPLRIVAVTVSHPGRKYWRNKVGRPGCGLGSSGTELCLWKEGETWEQLGSATSLYKGAPVLPLLVLARQIHYLLCIFRDICQPFLLMYMPLQSNHDDLRPISTSGKHPVLQGPHLPQISCSWPTQLGVEGTKTTTS